MLTAAAPTVKFEASATPEERACAQAIDQSLTTFWTLVEQLRAAAAQRQPIHHVEETIFRALLTMGRPLLEAFLALSGDGDTGPTLIVPGERPSDPPQVWPRLDQPRSRSYLSLFGAIPITRTCYGQDRVEAAPLDAQLHLPRRQYSYLFQQWLGAFVIDDAHAEAIHKLQTILGLGISVKASEDLNREQASDVEPFQNRLPVPEPAQEGPLLVVTADCKGVPWCGRRWAPRKRPTPRSGRAPRPLRGIAVARARKRTGSRWRRWGRSIPSNRSCARPTR